MEPKPPSVPPAPSATPASRVERIIALLRQNQPVIEQNKSGSITIHFKDSSVRVTLEHELQTQ